MVEMINWQDRFSQQLKWTKQFREFLYQKVLIGSKNNLLDIGCGTGELLVELGKIFELELHGMDINDERLKIAKENLVNNSITANLTQADILNNSWADETFDVITTHY